MMGRCRSADDVKQGAVRLPTNPMSRPEKLELSSTQEPKYWEVLCEFRSQGYLTTLAKLARLVRQKFLLWCAKLGDNGGLLTNGFVLRICVVQLLLWYNMVLSLPFQDLYEPLRLRLPVLSVWLGSMYF